jgi:hypothetical protein
VIEEVGVGGSMERTSEDGDREAGAAAARGRSPFGSSLGDSEMGEAAEGGRRWRRRGGARRLDVSRGGGGLTSRG